MSVNLENSSVDKGLEKVCFHSNPKEGQCQRIFQLPYNCTNKVMLKILQARLQQYVNQYVLDVQAGFIKGRGTRDQIANIHWPGSSHLRGPSGHSTTEGHSEPLFWTRLILNTPDLQNTLAFSLGCLRRFPSRSVPILQETEKLTTEMPGRASNNTESQRHYSISFPCFLPQN